MAQRPSEADSGIHMVGGPALASIAALRTGAGLCRLAMPEPVLDAALTIAPEATGLALAVDAHGELIGHLCAAAIDEIVAGVQCLAIGPGLGVGEGQRAAALRAVGQSACPVIVDADAINALSEVPALGQDFHASAVLTPHVGEFRRLAPAVGVQTDPEEDSKAATAELAQRLGCVVVLKSAQTTVSDGMTTWVHDRPNPALATAGSGDVLCGIVASLVAQHFRAHMGMSERAAGGVSSEMQGGLSLFDCARIGVAIHAEAGARWVNRHGGVSGGLLAGDLTKELPEVVESFRSPGQ